MNGRSPSRRRRSDTVSYDGTWTDALGDDELIDHHRNRYWWALLIPSQINTGSLRTRPWGKKVNHP